MALVERLRAAATWFEGELSALALAARDHRVGWPARLIVGVTLLYVISPIDLIPDAAHVLGGLDDLILLPLSLLVAVRVVPFPVMRECRARAVTHPLRDLRWWMVVLIVLAWQLGALLLARWWPG